MTRTFDNPPKYESLPAVRQAALYECHVTFFRDALAELQAGSARIWAAMYFAHRNGMDETAGDDLWLVRKIDDVLAEYKTRLTRREDQLRTLKDIVTREAAEREKLCEEANRKLRKQSASFDWMAKGNQ